MGPGHLLGGRVGPGWGVVLGDVGVLALWTGRVWVRDAGGVVECESRVRDSGAKRRLGRLEAMSVAGLS